METKNTVLGIRPPHPRAIVEEALKKLVEKRVHKKRRSEQPMTSPPQKKWPSQFTLRWPFLFPQEMHPIRRLTEPQDVSNRYKPETISGS